MAKKKTVVVESNEDRGESYSRFAAVKMEEIIPQVMGGVMINIIDGFHTQVLPDGMTGDKYRTWRKSRSGVFSRDALKYSRNKPCGEYFVYESDDERYIGRIIAEDELLMFQTFKLVDGKIVDVNYMKLRNLEKGEKLTNSTRYIKRDELEDEEALETILVSETPVEEDPETLMSSISLFDE